MILNKILNYNFPKRKNFRNFLFHCFCKLDKMKERKKEEKLKNCGRWCLIFPGGHRKMFVYNTMILQKWNEDDIFLHLHLHPFYAFCAHFPFFFYWWLKWNNNISWLKKNQKTFLPQKMKKARTHTNAKELEQNETREMFEKLWLKIFGFSFIFLWKISCFFVSSLVVFVFSFRIE